jgi:DNA-binding NarL/FixJ family response regulator
MKTVSILLIEDNRLIREGLSAMLNEQEDLSIVAATGSSDAVARAKRTKPSVILLDLGLHNQNSLRMIGMLLKCLPKAKIVGMDLVPTQEDLVQYVEAGVAGFVVKDATLTDFLATVRAVARGYMVLPPTLTGSLFTEIAKHATRRGRGNPFVAVRMTRREREVISLIAEGLSNKEIAHRLHLAIDTVKSHVHNILEKLALHTRLEIASYAHANPASERSTSVHPKD